MVFQLIKSSEGSILACPVSLEIILACTSLGARHSTQSQIRKVLHIPNNDDFVKSSYHGLVKSLNVSMMYYIINNHIFSEVVKYYTQFMKYLK